MSTVLTCLIIAVLLPLLVAGASVPFRIKAEGRVSLKSPRDQAARLTGAGERVVAAQSNAWEALAMYSAALLAANLASVDINDLVLASIIFIAARIAHAIFYVCNIALMRSLSFAVALGCCLRIFYVAFQTI